MERVLLRICNVGYTPYTFAASLASSAKSCDVAHIRHVRLVPGFGSLSLLTAELFQLLDHNFATLLLRDKICNESCIQNVTYFV